MKYLCKSMITMMIVAFFLLPFQVNCQQVTQAPTFSKEEIEQLVAPIALYPDPLLSQMLMASTYPLEIVSAARWRKANPNLKDKALEDALQKQTWDPSVKSLTATPEALELLNQNIDMTQKLGDAFLAQQKDVLAAVQRLRAKAEDKGNLRSSKEQVVKKTNDNGSSVITILPADPEVIYVPIYDPNIIYGSWPYADYPPYYYHPPGYDIGTALISFGIGLAVGNALWGDFNWRDGYANIDINRFNSFNRTNINDNIWRHDVAHREGVRYRDAATQEKFGKSQLKDNTSREAFRERAEVGQKQLKGDKAIKDKAARTNQMAPKKSQAQKQSVKKNTQPKQHNKVQNRKHQQHQQYQRKPQQHHRNPQQYQRKPQTHQRSSMQRSSGGHGGGRSGGRGGRR